MLSKKLLREAWGHKFPHEAVAYGKALLAAAEAAGLQIKRLRAGVPFFRA